MAAPKPISNFKPEKEARDCREFAISDGNMKYRMELRRAADCAAYLVDGGIINDPNELKCDKVVYVSSQSDVSHAVFVEFKGSDVEHAVKQLRSTLCHPLFKDSQPRCVKARIVAKQIPANSGNSRLETAKVEFVRRFKCELRVLRNGATDVIDNG